MRTIEGLFNMEGAAFAQSCISRNIFHYNFISFFLVRSAETRVITLVGG